MSLIIGARERRLDVNGLTFTAYEMGEGPLVLCLHGFPDTPDTWRHLLPRLAQEGFRAVAVTSRGYQPSSQPNDGDYSLAALAGDVAGWMDALGEDKAHLIGHDWGSSILHLAAAAAPERTLSLTALAVPHPAGFSAVVARDFDQLARSWYVFFFQAGGLADFVAERDEQRFLAYLWSSWSPGWTPPEEHLVAMRTMFSRPGVPGAALAYYRTSFLPTHARAADTQRLLALPLMTRTLGLAGERDGCVSPSVFNEAMAISPFRSAAVLETIPDAGHFLHLEQPELVNERIVTWLSARQRRWRSSVTAG